MRLIAFFIAFCTLLSNGTWAQNYLSWQEFEGAEPCPGLLAFPMHSKTGGIMLARFKSDLLTSEQQLSLPFTNGFWSIYEPEDQNWEGFSYSLGLATSESMNPSEGLWVEVFPYSHTARWTYNGELMGKQELRNADSLRLYILPKNRESAFILLSVDSRYERSAHPKNELVLFKLDLRSDLRHLSLFFTIRINEEHLAFLKEQNTGLCALFSPVEQQINTFDEEEIRIVENREYNHQDFIPPVWTDDEDPGEREPPAGTPPKCNSSFRVSPRSSGMIKNFSAAVQSDEYTYSWDFGDGTTATSASPSHNYTTEGHYSVSLTVSRSNDPGTARTSYIPVYASLFVPPAPGSLKPVFPSQPSVPANVSENYQATQVFDESEDLFSSSIAYKDGLGRSYQTIEYTENAPYAHVRQQVYDEFGRPALSTKSAPVAQAGLGFVSGFIKDPNGGAFNWQDLNTTDPAVGTTSELGKYYRQGQIEEHVAQTKRPYTQTRYLNQPGASPHITARPGDAFGIGSSKKKTMTFSLRAGSELDYMYGHLNSYLVDDSGSPLRNDNKDVVKTISENEDGQKSVSFYGADGQLIATCRSGIATQKQQTSSTWLEPFQSQLIHVPLNEFKVYFHGRAHWSLDQTDTEVTVMDGVTGQPLTGLSTPFTAQGNGGYYTITRIAGSLPEFVRVSVAYTDEALARYNRYYSWRLPGAEIHSDLDYTDWTFSYYDLQGRIVKSIAPKQVDNSFSADPSQTVNIVRSEDLHGTNVSTHSIFATEHLPASSDPANIWVHLRLQSHLSANGGGGTGPVILSAMPGGTPAASGTSQNYNMLPGDQIPPNGSPYITPPYTTFFNPNDVLNAYTVTKVSTANIRILFPNNTGNQVTLTYTVSYYKIITVDGTHIRNYSEYWTDGFKQWSVLNIPSDFRFQYISGTYTATYGPIGGSGWCGTTPIVSTGTLTSNPPPNESVLISNASSLNVRLRLDIRSGTGGDATGGNSTSSHYITKYTYDDFGRLTKLEHPDAGTTRIKYNSKGQPRFIQTAENAANNVVQYRNYDNNNRLVEAGDVPFTAIFGPGTSLGWSALNPDGLQGFLWENLSTSWYYYDTYPSSYPIPSSYATATNYSYSSYYTAGKLTVASNGHSTKWFGYDYKGRLKWEITEIMMADGQTQTRAKHYHYDYFDRLTKTVYNPENPNLAISQQNQYDTDFPTQLDKVLIDYDPNNTQYGQIADYSYYQSGQLKRTELGNYHQGIDYLYTVEGWLKAINAPVYSTATTTTNHDPGGDKPADNNFQQDLFGMSLDYYSGDYKSADNLLGMVGNNVGFSNNSAGNSHTGKVMAHNWYQAYSLTGLSFGQTQSYQYSYDHKNQLTQAVYGTLNISGSFLYDDAFKVSGISYDDNGNILSIKRRDQGGTLLDDLTYSYAAGKNRLSSLTDAVTTTPYLGDVETSGQAMSFGFNASGQLSSQPYDGYTMTYNGLGQLATVSSSAGVVKKYAYGPLGELVIKETRPNSSQPKTELYFVFAGQTEEVYRSQGYGASSHYIYGNGRIGTIERTTSKMIFEIQDHLGHVRTQFEANPSGNLTTTSLADYFPFGMALPGRSYNFSDQSHAFQGAFARRDHDTRWDEFLLRNYDARIGQFLSVDPFLQYASPYVAMGNNPLSVVDPTGGLGMDLSPEVGPIEHRDYDYNWEIAFELVYGFGMNMYEARLLAMSSGVRGLHIAREMAAFGYEWKEGSGWGFWKKANFKDAQRHPPFRGLDKMNVLSTVTVGEQWVEVYNPLDKYWAASYEYKPMTERFYSQPRDFSNSKTALGAGGLLYGIGQNVMAPGDQWLGNNGKYYNKSWGGNKWTGSRSGALKIAKAAKLAGRATFFGGAAISISEGVYHGAQGNYAEIAKPGLDLGMGTAAAFGGPIGLTIGGFYLIIDVTIGWDNAMQSHGSITRQNQAILGPSWNAFRMEGGIR